MYVNIWFSLRNLNNSCGSWFKPHQISPIIAKRSLSKTRRVNKNCHQKVSHENLSFGIDFKLYAVFRQAFLLIQYSFICKQYFFCSDREYQYFFWQMVNKTADCFNNIVLVVKISRKNLLKKWKTTQLWKKSYECLTGTPSCCG